MRWDPKRLSCHTFFLPGLCFLSITSALPAVQPYDFCKEDNLPLSSLSTIVVMHTLNIRSAQPQALKFLCFRVLSEHHAVEPLMSLAVWQIKSFNPYSYPYWCFGRCLFLFDNLLIFRLLLDTKRELSNSECLQRACCYQGVTKMANDLSQRAAKAWYGTWYLSLTCHRLIYNAGLFPLEHWWHDHPSWVQLAENQLVE